MRFAEALRPVVSSAKKLEAMKLGSAAWRIRKVLCNTKLVEVMRVLG